jgi:L-ascorbate metabolism protein UlaG (beta-lactamase superfamily)
MHYNTFPVIADDPEVFRAKVEATGRSARVMGYGETIEL